MKHNQFGKKIKKCCGKFLYSTLGQWLPVSYCALPLGQKFIRGFCAHLILERCGKKINVERRARFSSKVQLGDRSGIGAYSNLSGKVIIGNDVMMGAHCTIYTRNHAFERCDIPMNQQGFQEEKPVFIGDDVWIGSHVIILPGVHVGAHSVIGAGSIVTKDIPSWGIAAGNPAVVKKYRCYKVNTEDSE